MGYGRSMLIGAVLGLLVVALGVVGAVYVLPGARSPMQVAGDRVLLVVGSRSGVDDSQVAHLVAMADLARGGLSVALVDPMTEVAVPGTSYDRLRDAYPFGGGAGVSQAYAQAKRIPPLPVITVSEQGLRELVDALGGIETSVPASTNVFDGTKVFTFAPGPQRLSGADVVALLSSQEYLQSAAERSALASAVAAGLLEGLAANPDAAIGVKGGVTSTLGAEDLAAVARRLRSALPGAKVTSFAE